MRQKYAGGDANAWTHFTNIQTNTITITNTNTNTSKSKAVSKDGLGRWRHLWWWCQCVNTFHPQMIGSQSQKTSSSSYRVVCEHREGAQKIVGKSSGWTEGRDASQMWDAVMQLICKQWWVQKRAIGVVVNCPIGKAQSGVIAFWIVFAFWLTTPGGGGGKASPCA